LDGPRGTSCWIGICCWNCIELNNSLCHLLAATMAHLESNCCLSSVSPCWWGNHWWLNCTHCTVTLVAFNTIMLGTTVPFSCSWRRLLSMAHGPLLPVACSSRSACWNLFRYSKDLSLTRVLVCWLFLMKICLSVCLSLSDRDCSSFCFEICCDWTSHTPMDTLHLASSCWDPRPLWCGLFSKIYSRRGIGIF
jgi:hypothetical protein